MSSIPFRKLAAFGAISFSVAVSQSLPAVEVNDLLSQELWALKNAPRTTAPDNVDPNQVAATGTCAERPDINAGNYTCNTYTPAGVEDMDINAEEGWDHFVPATGLPLQPVVIALIDTGIDYRHPDLKNKVWLNPGEATGTDLDQNGVDDGCEDAIDGDNNGYLNDCHGANTLVPRVNADGSLNSEAGDPIDNAAGHGTNMAGVMAAEGNNASADYHGGIVGVVGLQPDIRVATCKSAQIEPDVLPLVPGVAVPAAKETAIRDCLWYFYNLKQAGVNIAVINASGGMSRFVNLYGILFPTVGEAYLLDTPEMYLLADLLEAADIPVVAAAGNNSWSIDQKTHERAYFPASFENNNIIGVGATSNQGTLWSGSSYGRWSVDVLAPGEDILSTAPTYPIFPQDSADFVVTHGTSQATAFVTGIIAMLKANADTQNLDAFSIKRLLMSSGKPVTAGQDKTVSGALVRLADTDGKGALTCTNQVFTRRQSPKADNLVALPGETLHLEVQSFDCAAASGVGHIAVSVAPTGETFNLYDDGLGDDAQANDGIYSGSWTVPFGEFEYSLSTGWDSVKSDADELVVTAAIIVDNTDETDWTGKWWPSIYRGGFYGSNYRYASVNDPEKLFLWSPTVNEANYYRVYARWPDGPNFATNATYRINHHDAVTGNLQMTLLQVDQTQNGGTWMDLGVYWFDAGTQSIELTNLNANGTVVADAILLVPDA
ncbi:MAG: S8 family serine peptidase [Pseudomonadota bacterium]|nr:S8 family serine peptidase [Pseudomonadota bacterium]